MKTKIVLLFLINVVIHVTWAQQVQDPNPVWQQVPADASAVPDVVPAATTVDDPVASAYKHSPRRRKNRFRARYRQREKAGDAPDDYYYDRDDEYGAPKAPASSYDAPSQSYDAPAQSYDAPAPSYQAPSYQAPSYQAPSYYDDGYGGGGYGTTSRPPRAHDEDKATSLKGSFSSGYGGGSGYGYGHSNSGFNDFLNALAAFLPIGLFLAAIPPNLITINTSTGRRKRDLNDNEVWNETEKKNLFMDEIMALGFNKMNQVECQKKIFCQMAAFGGFNENANTVQKTFFNIAALTPRMVSDSVGVSDVFEAASSGQCEVFKCNH